MHYWTIIALMIFMILVSAINHSNIEIYPKGPISIGQESGL